MSVPPALCPDCNTPSLLVYQRALLHVKTIGTSAAIADAYGNSFPVLLDAEAECNRSACGWKGTLRDARPSVTISSDHLVAIKRAFEEEIVNTLSDQFVGKLRPTSSVLATIKDQARRLGYDCEPFIDPNDPCRVVLGNLTLSAETTFSAT